MKDKLCILIYFINKLHLQIIMYVIEILKCDRVLLLLCCLMLCYINDIQQRCQNNFPELGLVIAKLITFISTSKCFPL